jgi:tRNA threonylcarbamoyladenosine biosynthesis protein TsaE
MELVYGLEEIGEAAKTVVDITGVKSVVAFNGEMGAGKTTFIQAICRSLGVKGSMGSPTFSIINEYISETGVIYHIDLYRCRSEDEAIRAGVEDCLFSGNLCLVEWPSRAEGIFPPETVRIDIKQLEEGKRKIIVNCRK